MNTIDQIVQLIKDSDNSDDPTRLLVLASLLYIGQLDDRILKLRKELRTRNGVEIHD